MGYVLPQSFFTAEQLKATQTSAMSAIIAKCGYNRKSKTKIIYGPKLLAGAGFVALYVIQGTGQIKLFLRFWRTTGQASRLLKVALGWAQLMAGIYQPILTNTTTPLLHLTVCWSKSLRTFLQFLDAEIELHQDQVLPIQRQYDENVMDRILSSEAFTDKAIKQINNCQLFPQSVTISDLCTACGTRLDPFFLKGETSLLSSTTNWITTNQQRPGEPAWKTWRRAMRIWSRNDGTLYRPLGAWLHPGDTLRRTWPFYNKDLRYPFLYIRTPWGFLQYEDNDNDIYSRGVITAWVPSAQSVPVHADAILLKDAWMITKLPLLLPPSSPITFASSFEEYL
jgi:hypothetical protein